jgi:iron(III) transport system substrate-binding protein
MTIRIQQQHARSRATLLLVVGIGCLVTGCWSRTDHEVIVYAALDREFSEPILDDFTAAKGIKVLAKYDIESTKTVQLVAAIMGEQSRPRCDLFWNNEILHTVRLQRAGLLDAYVVPSASDFPSTYRDADGLWYGIAARARVLLVNTNFVPADEYPSSLHDLIDPRWKGQVGIAKPRFGTTATHAAVLFSKWGDGEARKFFEDVRDRVQVMSGNKQVATAVGRGQLAFGLTDTDDAIIEIDNGRPVKIIFPDQQPDQMGALFIPNTLCLIKGSPNSANARRLMDYLLTPAVEINLARGRSAQFPVNTTVDEPSRALPTDTVRWMEVDFESAADHWESAQAALTEIFAHGY